MIMSLLLLFHLFFYNNLLRSFVFIENYFDNYDTEFLYCQFFFMIITEIIDEAKSKKY